MGTTKEATFLIASRAKKRYSKKFSKQGGPNVKQSGLGYAPYLTSFAALRAKGTDRRNDSNVTVLSNTR